MTIAKPIIFDGHNDVLSKIFNEGGLASAASFLKGREGAIDLEKAEVGGFGGCLLYTSPSPRDRTTSRMPSSA